MDKLSISQIAQFSGIKPHTIRMWEKRYDALKPCRTKGNTRYYSSAQLRRLLNITSLMKDDYKVSELCSASDDVLFKMVAEKRNKKSTEKPNGYFISQLIAAGMSYDEANFEKIFSHCLLRFGMRNTYKKTIYPMLNRLGLMWLSNDLPPAHEHFISNIIKQKIGTAIDSLAVSENDADSWLLFLPEDEFHEIGLLFANYLIRCSGKKVIYLGPNVPLSTLKVAVTDIEPENLFFFLVHYNLPKNTQIYLNQLKDYFNHQKIYVSGNQKLMDEINFGENLYRLNSIENLERKLHNNV